MIVGMKRSISTVGGGGGLSNVSDILENNSWGTIQSVGSSGTGSTYWDIGDRKSIVLNGTIGTLSLSNYTAYLFIIHFNYRSQNGVYFQGFKTASSGGYDIALCDSNYGNTMYSGTKTFGLCHWSYDTYGGWKGSDYRYDILGSTSTPPSGYGSGAVSGRTGYDASETAKTSPVSYTLMAAIPSDLRGALAPWTIYTDNTGNGTNSSSYVTASVDYITLLAEYEVFGARSSANSGEQNYQTQMSYYSNGGSKVKYKHSSTSTAVYWWTRSPYMTSSHYWYVPVNSSGSSSLENTTRSYGMAPAFRIA